MMVDYIMREDDVALIKGFVLVVDMAALGMVHIMHMTPTSTKKMAVAATASFKIIIFYRLKIIFFF
jgi:hypothetical protein